MHYVGYVHKSWNRERGLWKSLVTFDVDWKLESPLWIHDRENLGFSSVRFVIIV